MNLVYFMLGSNMGDRELFLNGAIEKMQHGMGEVLEISSVYETEPWGYHDDQFYLNQVIKVLSPLEPGELLQKINEIERFFGRVKGNNGYSARPIDIDILFYNDFIVSSELLTIPHREIQNRRFVLEPMAEVSPELVHPVLNKSMVQLLADCIDKSVVYKFQPSKIR